MAQIQGGFNPQNFDPRQGTPQLPVGKHPVIIVASDVKANSKNDGGFLEMELEIIDGPARGSRGAYRLNLYHQNQQTVEIAHRQLSAVCHAVGYLQPFNDSQVLHNLPFIVEVGLQNTPEGKEKGYTQVQRVYDKNGNEPGKTPSQAQPAGGGNWNTGGNPNQPAQGGQPAANWNNGGNPGGAGGQPAQGGQNWNQNAGGGAPAGGGGNNWNNGGGGGGAPNNAGQPAGGQPAGGGAPSWNNGGNGGGAPAGGGAPSWAK